MQTGSVARSSGGVDDRQAPRDGSSNTRERNDAQILQRMVISENPPARENVSKLYPHSTDFTLNIPWMKRLENAFLVCDGHARNIAFIFYEIYETLIRSELNRQGRRQ